VVPVLDKGFVKRLDYMGSDLAVVNAARVSFAKKSSYVPLREFPESTEPPTIGGDTLVLSREDCKLINYLAKHNHWTPFAHCQVSLHIKMPIFVARQLMRSNVGIVYNEISRRYVDTPPEFYTPDKWRSRPDKSLKQGSGEPIETSFGALLPEGGVIPTTIEAYHSYCVACYDNLLAQNVAPEQARIVLPVSMYTEVWATMSLVAAARIVNLRKDSHAQWEIRQYANAIDQVIKPLFPVSWAALTSKPNKEESSATA